MNFTCKILFNECTLQVKCIKECLFEIGGHVIDKRNQSENDQINRI